MYRRLEIENDITLSGYQGTHRMPLPREKAIGALEIVVKGVNAATSNSADAIEQYDVRRAVESLKVKSGKRVFYQTSGIQNRNIMTYESGRLPWEVRTQRAGASQYAIFTIPFWIEPMLPETGLPAPMLTSLDLELEYNFAQTSALIGWADTGHQVNTAVWLYDEDETDEALAQKQFRVIEQKHDHTSLASGVSPFTLTEDIARNLRRLYIEAYKVSVAEGGVISDVQVKKGNDEIYGSKWTAMQAGNAENCRLSWKQAISLKDSTSTTDQINTRVPNLIHGGYDGLADASEDVTEYVDALAIGVYTMENTASEEGYLHFSAQEIPTMAVIDWDLLKDLGNMVPQGPDKLTCNLTNAVADGEVKIVEESISRMWT